MFYFWYHTLYLLFLSVSLEVVTLIIFTMNKLLVSLIFSFVFCPQFHWFLPFKTFHFCCFGFILLFFFYIVSWDGGSKWLICDSSSIPLYLFSSVNFVLRTTLAVSWKFLYVVFSFSVISMHYSLPSYSLTHELFRSMLVSTVSGIFCY